MKSVLSALTVKGFAKVNLFLDITETRSDGYHNLNTIMQSITLADDVKIEVGGDFDVFISCDNPNVPCDERNIAYKAAKAFFKAVGQEENIKIRIEKRIPIEAGLGGSSADGAAVLRGLNELYGFPLKTEKLCEIGALLGADVPFCIIGGTRMCRGIGEIMTELEPLQGCTFLIVKPSFSCNTREAYKEYDKNPIPINSAFDEYTRKCHNAKNAANALYNIFEKLYLDGRIDEIKSELLSLGALGAVMTGSGSAVFGIYDNEKKAEKALNCIKNSNISFKILSKPQKRLEKLSVI